MSDQMVTFRYARQLTGLLGAAPRRWSRNAHLEGRRRGGGHPALLGALKPAPGEPLQTREDLEDLARVLGGAQVASRRQCSKHDLARPIAHPHERAVAPRPERELPVIFDVGSGCIDHGRAPRRVPARIQPVDLSVGTGTSSIVLTGFDVPMTVIGEDKDLSACGRSGLANDKVAVITALSVRPCAKRSAKARAIATCAGKGAAGTP